MNYKEILEDFQKRKMKTKNGTKISHNDLRYAVQVKFISLIMIQNLLIKI